MASRAMVSMMLSTYSRRYSHVSMRYSVVRFGNDVKSKAYTRPVSLANMASYHTLRSWWTLSTPVWSRRLGLHETEAVHEFKTAITFDVLVNFTGNGTGVLIKTGILDVARHDIVFPFSESRHMGCFHLAFAYSIRML